MPHASCLMPHALCPLSDATAFLFCSVRNQVMEALKILRGGVAIGEACKYTYCLREPTRKGLFLQPTPLEKPAASCFVCNTNTVSNVM